MTVKWFGKRYNAPVYDECPQVETPVGVLCQHCGKAIRPGEDGIVYGNGPVAHRSCFAWAVGILKRPSGQS
jgi:hypothetical protein